MKDTRAVQQIAQEQREHIIDSGIVRAVRGQYVDVLLDGTKKLVRDVIVSKSITAINVGWWVVIARVPHTNKWVALVTLESISTGSTADSSDLTTPANVTATAKPYMIELSWSGSFRDVATYEVQHNSSASETGATTLKIEGSNFFYWCAPGTQRYFRVRAVSSSFERSAWSSWVNATATSGSAYMFLGVNAAGSAPIWTAFNWTNVSGVAGAAMSHDHSTAAKGGQNLLSLVDFGFNASTELTIAAGAVTRTQVFHRIDTQGDDPTDDLDTINGGADGKLIIIRPENDARTVVVKHNTGNIWLSGRADISLDDAGDALVLLYVNALSKWVDIGWSEGGAGGAPADAQYLVLALDDTLSAERRFVDGDGLQATDGGAGGDYTLNIDVSDFAGAGLEDDGAENLQVNSTVVRTSGNQTIADEKTFSNKVIIQGNGLLLEAVAKSQGSTFPDLGTTTLAEKLGNVYLGTAKDTYPDGDSWGLWARLVNRYGLATYTDHFRSGVIPTGFTWQGGDFAGTPAALVYSYNGSFMLTAADGGGVRHFLSAPVTNSAAAWQNKVVLGRIRTGLVTEIGFRLDDGSDNNYAEIYMTGVLANATQRLDFRYRTGGGAVNTVPSALIIPVDSFMTALLLCYWSGAEYQVYGCVIAEDSLSVNVTGFATPVITWCPAAGRVGILVKDVGNYASVDWFYESFG